MLTKALLLLAWSLLLLIYGASAQTGNASCSDAYKFPRGSDFGKNIPSVFASLLRDAATGLYSTTIEGNAEATVYGLLQCRGDVSADVCGSCASTAVGVLNRTCVKNTTKGGRVQLEECFLRYEDHFFSSNLDTVSSLTNCSLQGNSTGSFSNNSQLVVTFLQDKVPNNATKFLVAAAGLGTSSPVYALGQCVRDLSAADCGTCLSTAGTVLSSTCTGKNGGACYFSTCMLRYESSKFFSGIPVNATLQPPKPSGGGGGGGGSGSSKSGTIGIVAGVVGGALLLLLLLGVFLASRHCYSKKCYPKKPVEISELEATLHRGPVTFTYDMLKRCTENFSDSHKLGEGGFGSVYMGVFSDGTEVAIKRLSVASKQGEQQFLNEVKIISSVQHRNLVKLLGCCIEGSERLLVYEFCKNNSLEKLLFEESSTLDSSCVLSWNTRLSILLGTARGLSYLHEDSQVRIVHRDIKPSNILLDEAFEAKIADFGLARLCSEDEISNIVTTKVAGTYGYMAPEYAFHGQLSEKADVFSFGIVILETLTSRRNRHQFLLEQAWELHVKGNLGEILDQKLELAGDAANGEKVLEAMRIGLMCSQGSPQARPSMSHVVAMLSGHSNVYVPANADFKPYSLSSATSTSTEERRQTSMSEPPEPR